MKGGWRILLIALIVHTVHNTANGAEPDEQVRHSGSGSANEVDFSVDKNGLSVYPLNISCTRPTCDGPLKDIYCHGEILSVSWQLGMQDRCPGEKLTKPADEVLANFKKLARPITAEVFSAFCSQHFERTRYLEDASFPDWKPDPETISKIAQPKSRKLALEVHRRWKVLGRRFIAEVFEHPSLYPVLPVPNPFIVPGGDFDIYFYWDSYWAIRGLLISNMTSTVKGIIENFAFLINTHGFIPNSGKISLSSRTHPPLFTQMLFDFSTYAPDANFTLTMLSAVEKELTFFEMNRTRTVKRAGKTYTLFQYRANSNCPRPENYLVDYYQGMNSSRAAESVWSSTASACESGWDFSSRWFAQNGSDAYNKRSIHTNEILPVDLNTFMAWNYRAAAKLYHSINETSKAAGFRAKFQALSKDLHEFFWDAQEGVWFDYDLEVDAPRKSFFPSNIFPLLVLQPGGEAISRITEYLDKNHVFNFSGGVPTTLPVPSFEQWDFPNLWAPTMHLWVMSLLRSRDAFLVEKAKTGADHFIETVYMGVFSPPNGTAPGIWEKYDATKCDGSHGGGGEYPVQEGFAWTNGAVVDLIMMFDQPAVWGVQRRMMAESEFEAPLSADMEFLGGFPHNVIVVSLIAFCLLLGAIFSAFSIRSLHRYKLRATPRTTRAREERASSQMLLNDSDNED